MICLVGITVFKEYIKRHFYPKNANYATNMSSWGKKGLKLWQADSKGQLENA